MACFDSGFRCQWGNVDSFWGYAEVGGDLAERAGFLGLTKLGGKLYVAVYRANGETGFEDAGTAAKRKAVPNGSWDARACVPTAAYMPKVSASVSAAPGGSGPGFGLEDLLLAILAAAIIYAIWSK